MIRDLKILIMKCYYFIKSLYCRSIYVGEYVTDRNFEDALNFVILKKLYGVEVIPKRFCFKFQYDRNDNLLFIGSVMKTSDRNSLVWGAGIMERTEIIKGVKKIFSVRGPITRKLLLSQGFECPPIYGDPALLMPRIYASKSIISHKIGFIPHFLDKDKFIVRELLNDNLNDVLYIDIQMPKSIFIPTINSYYKLFINKIASCEVIISSCLHGLIIGDAYKKKTLWVKFGNDIGGDDVKFYDYYASMGIGENEIEPIDLRKNQYSLDILYRKATLKPIDKINMDIFLQQNPFNYKLLI